MPPESITVDGKPAKFQVEAGSLVALTLPDGAHTLSVQAKAYNPMEFSTTVSGAETPVMEIELDPMHHEDAEPVAPDAAVVEGNVSDADTGELLSQVRVTIPDAQQSTVTGESGSFGFQVIVGDTASDVRAAITLEAKAEGYKPVRMKNVALAAGQRRRMQIRLDRETTSTASSDPVEIDESTRAGSSRSSDWTYDVTIQ